MEIEVEKICKCRLLKYYYAPLNTSPELGVYYMVWQHDVTMQYTPPTHTRYVCHVRSHLISTIDFVFLFKRHKTIYDIIKYFGRRKRAKNTFQYLGFKISTGLVWYVDHRYSNVLGHELLLKIKTQFHIKNIT